MTNQDNVISALISSLCCLPGVGPRTATRMAYHLLLGNQAQGLRLSETLKEAMHAVTHCDRCNNLTTTITCSLCLDSRRNPNELCIVEMPSDLLAIEQSGVYKGRYFVLMGHLSPLDGIGPKELSIDKLLTLFPGDFKEVIFAISPTIEGEATRFYLKEQLKRFDVKLSELASGIPVGGDLEYLNATTIGNALTKRRELEPA